MTVTPKTFCSPVGSPAVGLPEAIVPASVKGCSGSPGVGVTVVAAVAKTCSSAACACVCVSPCTESTKKRT